MKVATAQIHPVAGKVEDNILKHLELAENASQAGVSMIFFSELSLTGYEPELAGKVASDSTSSIFTAIQDFVNQRGIIIGSGYPLRFEKGVHISMLIFRPNACVLVKSKEILHPDEEKYFVPSHATKNCLELGGLRIGFGICYESMHEHYYRNVTQEGCDLLVASVSKSQEGLNKAYLHYAKVSGELKAPLILSNSVGPCDNFVSAGGSAAWNEYGRLIGRLNNDIEGFIIYDTDLQTAEVVSINYNGKS